MSILLTGGTGKTGGHLARLLHESSKPYLVASRNPTKVPQPYKGVEFDWFNEQTWKTLPFEVTQDPIRGVYIIVPPGPDDVVIAAVKNFVDFAIQKGVQRFAVLSSSSLEKGQMTPGIVHAYLEERGVEYCALRPSWFMENFIVYQARRGPDSSTVYSATEDGKIPFVAAEDIAQAAFNALTASGPIPNDLIVVGPELLTYDDAAKALSAVTGRPSQHVRFSADELSDRFTAEGIPLNYARPLAELDVAIAGGHGEQAFYAANKFVGKVNIREFFEKHKETLNSYNQYTLTN